MKSERCLLALYRGTGLPVIPEALFNHGGSRNWLSEERVRAGTSCAAYNKTLTSKNEIVTISYICAGKLGLALFLEG